MTRVILFLIRLQKRRLERRMPAQWDRDLSLELDRLLVGEEARAQEPNKEVA